MFPQRRLTLKGLHDDVSQNKELFKTTAAITPVEAVSNSSTLALRVVGGDEKGTQYLEV
jgi:hypothetical protein